MVNMVTSVHAKSNHVELHITKALGFGKSDNKKKYTQQEVEEQHL